MQNVCLNLIRSLLFLLLMTVLSVPAFAQFAGGSGSQSDPYLVATAEHLNNVRFFLTSKFLQIEDINLGVAPWNQDEGWEPIGMSSTPVNQPFNGRYNGNGFTITGLYINRPGSSLQGLFGYVNYSILSNIKLYGVNITASTVAGGLAGNIANFSQVSHCVVTGQITSTTGSCGGLIGNIGQNVILTDCAANCNLTSSGHCGGLVSDSSLYCEIYRCYTLGTVNSNGSYAGGLLAISGNAIIENCFTKGIVQGNNYVGGLIGYSAASSITNCYSTRLVICDNVKGGLIALAYGDAEYCYWNIETSGITYSDGGGGRTTSEMTFPSAHSTYVNWDFLSIWHADESGTINEGYPYLDVSQPTPVSDAVNQTSDCSLMISPNPFVESVRLNIKLEKDARASLGLYNLKGQNIRTIKASELSIGENVFTWNGTDDFGRPLPTGIYFVILRSENKQLVQKVTFIK